MIAKPRWSTTRPRQSATASNPSRLSNVLPILMGAFGLTTRMTMMDGAKEDILLDRLSQPTWSPSQMVANPGTRANLILVTVTPNAVTISRAAGMSSAMLTS